LKTVIFDIEATDLAAVGAGILTCMCAKPADGGQMKTFRIDDYECEQDDRFGVMEREEKQLLADAVEYLLGFDLLVGHYIKKFDLPYIKSRSFQRSMYFNIMPLVYDTWEGVKRVGIMTVLNSFGGRCGSLGHVADYFGIKQEKNGIFPKQHWMSIWGNKEERKKSMDMVADHCRRDVRMNATVYPILLQLDTKALIRRLL
jgi:uncharacterized protein YprB with RNaseH-like and TPR domain